MTPLDSRVGVPVVMLSVAMHLKRSSALMIWSCETLFDHQAILGFIVAVCSSWKIDWMTGLLDAEAVRF